ncbi:hypothetical protein ACHQM5_023588 [Ranunculus cassubicifolius]
MGSEVAKVLLQCVYYEGCISVYDKEIERRPYHRNCSCALHKSKNGYRKKCYVNSNKISYPIKTTWEEGSFSLDSTNNHHQIGSSLPPSYAQTKECLVEYTTFSQ